jgi:hypothetical protein
MGRAGFMQKPAQAQACGPLYKSKHEIALDVGHAKRIQKISSSIIVKGYHLEEAVLHIIHRNRLITEATIIERENTNDVRIHGRLDKIPGDFYWNLLIF